MVLVFGVDVPLIEVLLTLGLITLLLLLESVVIIILLMRQMGKAKKISEAVEGLYEDLLKGKKTEIQKLDHPPARK